MLWYLMDDDSEDNISEFQREFDGGYVCMESSI